MGYYFKSNIAMNKMVLHYRYRMTDCKSYLPGEDWNGVFIHIKVARRVYFTS